MKKHATSDILKVSSLKQIEEPWFLCGTNLRQTGSILMLVVESYIEGNSQHKAMEI